MNIEEYEQVKAMSYLEYCDYLQEKYGIPQCAYFYPSFSKNSKVSRTKDGLVAHHKYEDHAILLSKKEFAMKNPYEWQLAENLVYCDYLEHLFLHILICEYPSPDANKNEKVGIGGVVEFLVPELNDVYSGWKSKAQWKMNCFDRIINDKDVYLMLIKRFKSYLYKEIYKATLQNIMEKKNGHLTEDKVKELLKDEKAILLKAHENLCKKFLLTSFSEMFHGNLDKKINNKDLFEEIMKL